MKHFLSGSVLKVIAMVCMVVDHATKMGVAEWPWMRTELFSVGNTSVTPAFIGACVIGRIAFPLFAFLCVEGFRHTRSIKRYMVNLLVFAVLSIVPFNLMNGHPWYFLHHWNVLFTLLLGVCGIYCMTHFKGVKAAAGVLLVLAIAFFFHCDYSAYGVALVMVMYLIGKPEYQCVALLAVFGRSKFTISAALASVPILLYNGERGFIHGSVWKYAFYAFYPLHMLLLWMVMQ